MKQKSKEHQSEETQTLEDIIEEQNEMAYKNIEQDNNEKLCSLALNCHMALQKYVSDQGYPLCEKLSVKDIMVFMSNL